MVDSASLLAVLPELILTAGGLVLMLVAAFGGDGSACLLYTSPSPRDRG